MFVVEDANIGLWLNFYDTWTGVVLSPFVPENPINFIEFFVEKFCDCLRLVLNITILIEKHTKFKGKIYIFVMFQFAFVGLYFKIIPFPGIQVCNRYVGAVGKCSVGFENVLKLGKTIWLIHCGVSPSQGVFLLCISQIIHV